MNNLKAFVRYDGSGHIVSGSLILRQFKPKVGNWEEIDAYECCKPSPSPENSLRLVFDDIINTTYLVDDASSVGDWNLYFDLPNYGSPFTSVSIEGNVVNLIGGSNIETRFGLFKDFDHLIEVDDTGSIITLGDETFACYNGTSILQRVSFPAVTRTIYETPETGDNYGCFGGCYVLEYANLPLLVNMEGSEFCECYLLSTLIIPYNEITSLGYYAFNDCHLLTSLDFPNLITAGIVCFSGCIGLTLVNLPSLTTAGDGCFSNCPSLTSLNLSSCTKLGTTVGDGNIFTEIVGNTITLTVPSALMTCNSGYPDADIQSLGIYNNVTINGNSYIPFTGHTGDLSLTFDFISNADILVGDSSNVNDWNTFFNLPNWSTQFASVEITDNIVTLIGGENIIFNQGLLASNNNILEINDTGCVCYIGYGCFSNCPSLTSINVPLLTTIGENCFDSCVNLTSINLPSLTTAGRGCFNYCTNLVSPDFSLLTTAGDYCFNSCEGLTSVDFPSLITAGEGCFYNCTSLTTVDLPLLITAGGYCFNGCTSLTSLNLPSLTTAGGYCFDSCEGLTSVDFPSLITAGEGCFYNCTSLTSLNLSSCTKLGTTVGDDYVFSQIIGNTITLRVPLSLMVCNGGNPDGDIQKLQLKI